MSEHDAVPGNLKAREWLVFTLVLSINAKKVCFPRLELSQEARENGQVSSLVLHLPTYQDLKPASTSLFFA